jgi:hypothetical protein
MLLLSLQDIHAKFGFTGAVFATWAVAAAATMALVMRFSAVRVSPASSAGHVIVRGSMAPMAMMMAVFATKYCASVAVAMAPHLRSDVIFSAALCALFGVLNGYFLGRVACDLSAYQSLSSTPEACVQVA